MKTKKLDGLKKEDFEKIVDDKSVQLFILTSRNGIEMSVTNYGARIVSLNVPNKKGKWIDIVLGKKNINDYLNDQEPYFGATCGRTANRIANGNFILNDKKYNLAVNNGINNLHGGIKGFHAVVWDAYQQDTQTLELTYLSKDGEEGFPGNLEVKVIYKLINTNTVEITYEAITDKITILNLTNHSYFNLSGEGNPSIDNHKLHINADTFLPINDVSIPLGKPEKVSDTPFDFRLMNTIGKHIEENHIQLIYGNGYDHNFIINRVDNDNNLVYAAKVLSPDTGITMEVYTTEPGIQFYTGNYLDGSFIGKNGHIYPKRSAFCLETQHYPDSIHFPEYPPVILLPNEVFLSKTEYRFTI
ncbi:MAG: galactose mutarotase [Bacteroidales bacterium OttesenSCG-928-I14]|jgi:aldose 1-epimerase|nr:galactose mutarotase [Bacteroidales bacterium OttesenSCG-928-I14]